MRLLFFILHISKILKKALILLLKYRLGFECEFLTPTSAARCITKEILIFFSLLFKKLKSVQFFFQKNEIFLNFLSVFILSFLRLVE